MLKNFLAISILLIITTNICFSQNKTLSNPEWAKQILVEAMSEKLSEIITNTKATLLLKENAFLTAKNDCSVEKMLEGFGKAIKHTSK